NREVTDVEEHMLEGFFQLVLRQLTEVWKSLVPVEFVVDSVGRKSQVTNRIARNEAVVRVAMQLRVGETEGPGNLAIPSITLKMFSQKIDQRWTDRKSEDPQMESAIAQALSQRLEFDLELALLGATVQLKDLMELEAGHLIDLGLHYDRKASLLVNGVP